MDTANVHINDTIDEASDFRARADSRRDQRSLEREPATANEAPAQPP